MRNSLKVPDTLLLTCPNGGGIALLDEYLCLPLAETDITGLALGTGAALWCLQENGANSVREVSNGQLRTVRLSDQPMDLHDILLEGEDVYVAATQLNAVIKLDRKLGEAKQHFTIEGESDSSHLNSLAVHNGRLVASIFGRFSSHRGYKGKTRGAGEVLDVGSGKTLLGGLSQPHSLVSDGERLYLCSSEDKELIVCDGFEPIKRVSLPGYARGLAIGDHHVYVGLSCSRNLEIESQTGYFESAAVAILRKKDLEIVGAIQVPWKEIYDIRVVRDRSFLQSMMAVCWEQERMLARKQMADAVMESRRELHESRETAANAYAALEKSSAESLRETRAQTNDKVAELRTELQGVREAAVRNYAALEKSSSDRLAAVRAELQDAREAAAKNYGVLEASCLEKISALKEQLATALAGLSKCESKIAQQDGVLSARNETLSRLRISHAEVGALVIRRQRELETKDARIAEMHASIVERDERARDLNGALANLRDHAATLQSKLEASTQRDAELQAKLAGRDQRIFELKAKVGQRDEHVEALQQKLVDARQWRTKVEGLVALRDGRVSELEADLTRARASEARLREVEVDRARLQLLAEEFQRVLSSRSWQLTKPLRFAMRLLRNRGLGGDDRARLWSLVRFARPEGAPSVVEQPMVVLATPRVQAAARSAALPMRSPSASEKGIAVSDGRALRPWLLRKFPAEVNLVRASAGVEDIFVWAVIDWHFRIQRPQHIARELAATGRRVFYVSNNFIDCADPGFKVEPLDESGRIFQVFLNVRGKPAIYFEPPDQNVQMQLDASMRELLLWTRSERTVSLVQHPFWSRVARALPNHRLVYDCMDHHGGFDNNGSGILALENELMRAADLLVVSSVWLDEEGAKFNGKRALIRNAGQYEHFSERPEAVFADPEKRPVIGYYGAIAPWFDVDLVEAVAQSHPDCLVLLVGADTCQATQRLSHCENVRFTGEVAYSDLPFYLHAFDACILPFKVLPLTLATNPVKAYEYLSAGKPVVTVDLPEMRQFGDLVRIAADRDGFIAGIAEALSEPEGDAVRQRRREFASQQTWSHRALELVEAIAAIPEPRVSVVVLTYNNLDLTKECLRSIELHSDYRNLEVIVVDNASSDGSQEYLKDWVNDAGSGAAERKLVLNEQNKGFAAGNNLGLEQATGDYLVLLNNDTKVTPGWVRTLLNHLKADSSIGIIGPVTNNIGNEAKIDALYDDDAGMLSAAADYTLRHAGASFALRTVAFFCVMMPRRCYERVGGLDEDFGMGFFEDDDYCRRIEAIDKRVVCAEDVFVHHHLSASFNKLAVERRKELFERNKALYEAKWGEWIPHRYRTKGAA
jgi:GT2 family glycosyltransferase